MRKPALGVAEIILHINDDDGGVRQIEGDLLVCRLHRKRPWRDGPPNQIGRRLRDYPAVACTRAERPQAFIVLARIWPGIHRLQSPKDANVLRIEFDRIAATN